MVKARKEIFNSNTEKQPASKTAGSKERKNTILDMMLGFPRRSATFTYVVANLLSEIIEKFRLYLLLL